MQLADYEILPCRGCFACKGRGNCVFAKDGFAEIFSRMVESDGMILGSPVYSADVSAQRLEHSQGNSVQLTIIEVKFLRELAGNRGNTVDAYPIGLVAMATLPLREKILPRKSDANPQQVIFHAY